CGGNENAPTGAGRDASGDGRGLHPEARRKRQSNSPQARPATSPSNVPPAPASAAHHHAGSKARSAAGPQPHAPASAAASRTVMPPSCRRTPLSAAGSVLSENCKDFGKGGVTVVESTSAAPP